MTFTPPLRFNGGAAYTTVGILRGKGGASAPPTARLRSVSPSTHSSRVYGRREKCRVGASAGSPRRNLFESNESNRRWPKKRGGGLVRRGHQCRSRFGPVDSGRYGGIWPPFGGGSYKYKRVPRGVQYRRYDVFPLTRRRQGEFQTSVRYIQHTDPAEDFLQPPETVRATRS